MYHEISAACMLAAAAEMNATAEINAANRYAVWKPMPAHAAQLLWSDEFNGRSLDSTKWSFDTSRNKTGWLNGELQYYSANRRQNARVEDGRLVIEARLDRDQIRDMPDWGGQRYSSARITTNSKESFNTGFIEVSAKLPCARGAWPAIWMRPQFNAGWPGGGEIDILEQVGFQPNVIHATVHTGLFNHLRGNERSAATRVGTACTAFHLYQVAWTAESITVGVDNHAYMQVMNDRPGGRDAWPFNAPFYLILNLAIGGRWAGAKGIDDGALPQRLEVDYVRVWAMSSK